MLRELALIKYSLNRNEGAVTFFRKRATQGRVLFVGNNDNNGLNGNNNLNNNGRFVGIVKLLFAGTFLLLMALLHDKICEYDNLKEAFQKARKGKTLKLYVIDFERDLEVNLKTLRNELLLHCYRPKPLETFILRDPKTRKISKSDFRDRIVHHAICNIIEPTFEKQFIYDSYANRVGKGTLKAIGRLHHFKKIVSKNNSKTCYVLKADIRQYFETVDHNVLLSLLAKMISDKEVLWLISIILENHQSTEKGKGMPLGNLTSQFFANVYLHELDEFVKHALKAKYYIRYVDDFIILHENKEILEAYKDKISNFLNTNLFLQLHPAKSKILTLNNGINFLGFRVFFHHILIRKKNAWKFERKLKRLKKLCAKGKVDREKVIESLEGWLAYVSHADTYKYRRKIVRAFNIYFPLKLKIKDNAQEKVVLPAQVITKKTKNFQKKIRGSQEQFSYQKTVQLLKKRLSIQKVAEFRDIKEGTVWEHAVKGIASNNLSIYQVLTKERVLDILFHIHSPVDTLKMIKERIPNPDITYNEIACVIAYYRVRNRKCKKNTVPYIPNDRQNTHQSCQRIS